MEPITIGSWEEYQSQCYQESYRPDLGRYRSPFAFRGVGVADWHLETSLQRLGHNKKKLPVVEDCLLRNFEKYAEREDLSSTWRRMAVAQHFGLPTTLLDWTFSPFVALHFATANSAHMKEDAAVWCVNVRKAHSYAPNKMINKLKKNSSMVFTLSMLDKFKSLSEFDSLKGIEPTFPTFFEPPSLDGRIINQVALFSFLNEPSIIFDSWLKEKSSENSDLAKKIIIPSDLKWEFRDKLDQANINERVLFPGLDGLSQWLARWYSLKS